MKTTCQHELANFVAVAIILVYVVTASEEGSAKYLHIGMQRHN